MFEVRNKVARIGHLFGLPAVKVLTLGVAGTIVLSIVEMGVAALLQAMLNSFGIGEDSEKSDLLFNMPTSPEWLLSCLVVLALMRGIGFYFVQIGAGHSAIYINNRLRELIARSVVFGSLSPDVLELRLKLSESLPKSSNFAFALSQTIAAALQMGVLFVLLFIVSWKLAFSAMVFVAAIGLIVIALNRVVRRVGGELPNQLKSIVGHIEGLIDNWMLISLYDTKKFELDRFEKDSLEYVEVSKKVTNIASLSGAIPPFLGILIMAVLLYLNHEFKMLSGDLLLVFFYIFVRFVQNLGSAANSFGIVSSCYPFFKDVWDYFEVEGDSAISESIDGSGKVGVCSNPPPTIELRNVSFAYPGRDLVLSDLCMQIASGSQFGITGASGKGKSTVLKLLLGVYAPTTGDARIDGACLTTDQLSKKYDVGYVGAEPYLFPASIRENLMYGARREITNAELSEVLYDLNLVRNRNIDEVNGFLNLDVDLHGANLSAGQRQRICIARAVLRKPKLLVLDEATANIDSETEKQISENISKMKKKCTVVIVSHRKNFLKYSDEVFDLA